MLPAVKACLLATALTLSGCASIIGESQYPVAIKSTPEGTTFVVTDKDGNTVHSGTSPSTVTLKSGAGYFRGQTYTLTFKKEGYADKTVQLDSSVSGWYWGNILFGGLIGMLFVDPATGVMYKLPENFSADLGAAVASQQGSNNMVVATTDTLPDDLRKQLIKLINNGTGQPNALV